MPALDPSSRLGSRSRSLVLGPCSQVPGPLRLRHSGEKCEMKNRLAISKHETLLPPSHTPQNLFLFFFFVPACVCVWGLQTHPDILTAGAMKATAAPGAGSVVSMVNKLLSRYFITSLVVSDSCEGGAEGVWQKRVAFTPNPLPGHLRILLPCVFCAWVCAVF